MRAQVGRIFVYPIKSLDGIALTESRILPGGSLQHDREFALFDDSGKWINGKREPRIHSIRAHFDLDAGAASLGVNGSSETRTFDLTSNEPLERWFSDYFGFRVHLDQNTETGFPDDPDASGPTIVTSETLRTVADWFGIADVDQVRRRFRPNIEIDGVPPFWEDQLFGDAGEIVDFRLGNVAVHGINPCQRCVVPSRDPDTAASIENFQRMFSARRAETLPPWAVASRFDHFYRLSVNTRIPASEAGKAVRVGDGVRIARA